MAKKSASDNTVEETAADVQETAAVEETAVIEEDGISVDVSDAPVPQTEKPVIMTAVSAFKTDGRPDGSRGRGARHTAPVHVHFINMDLEPDKEDSKLNFSSRVYQEGGEPGVYKGTNINDAYQVAITVVKAAQGAGLNLSGTGKAMYWRTPLTKDGKIVIGEDGATVMREVTSPDPPQPYLDERQNWLAKQSGVAPVAPRAAAPAAVAGTGTKSFAESLAAELGVSQAPGGSRVRQPKAVVGTPASVPAPAAVPTPLAETMDLDAALKQLEADESLSADDSGETPLPESGDDIPLSIPVESEDDEVNIPVMSDLEAPPSEE